MKAQRIKVGDEVDVDYGHYAGGRWGVVKSIHKDTNRRTASSPIYSVSGGTVGDAGLLLSAREISKRRVNHIERLRPPGSPIDERHLRRWREMVKEEGYTHDCAEWIQNGKCQLCDAALSFEHTVSLEEVEQALAELSRMGVGTTLDRPAAILHRLRSAIKKVNP